MYKMSRSFLFLSLYLSHVLFLNIQTAASTIPTENSSKKPSLSSQEKAERISGFVIAYFVNLVVVAAMLYWLSRQTEKNTAKRDDLQMNTSPLCKPAATFLESNKEPEGSITNQAFAEDSESPENATATESREAIVVFNDDTKF